MAPCARGNKYEPALVNAVDKQQVRLDMALAMPAARPVQRVVAHRFGQILSAHERLEGRLEFGDVLALPLEALVVLLNFAVNLSSIMAYSSSSAAMAFLTVQ